MTGPRQTLRARRARSAQIAGAPNRSLALPDVAFRVGDTHVPTASTSTTYRGIRLAGSLSTRTTVNGSRRHPSLGSPARPDPAVGRAALRLVVMVCIRSSQRMAFPEARPYRPADGNRPALAQSALAVAVERTHGVDSSLPALSVLALDERLRLHAVRNPHRQK
jgi:hypothetical protein